MATWKKVIVSGSAISELNNDTGFITSGDLAASVSGSSDSARTNLNNITADETAQLLNIGSVTISNTQWGYLGAQDQSVVTTADVQFTSVTASLEGSVVGNVTGDVTGNADSATAIASAQNFSITGDGTATAVSFDGTSAVALSLSLADDSVDSAEIADGAVDAVHFGTTAKTAVSGAFTTTSSSIATDIASLVAGEFSLNLQGDSGNGIIDKSETLDIAGGSNLTTTMSGNTLTVALDNDVTIAGNLTVQGTRTELNVANLNVEDQFILLNSGSVSGDSGIVFGGTGDGVANAGHAIFVDDSDSNGATFGFKQNLAHDVTTGGTPDSKLGNIESSTAVPVSAPTFQGVGTIHIKTDTEDIYIYS
jgi:hypothetical protein